MTRKKIKRSQGLRRSERLRKQRERENNTEEEKEKIRTDNAKSHKERRTNITEEEKEDVNLEDMTVDVTPEEVDPALLLLRSQTNKHYFQYRIDKLPEGNRQI